MDGETYYKIQYGTVLVNADARGDVTVEPPALGLASCSGNEIAAWFDKLTMTGCGPRHGKLSAREGCAKLPPHPGVVTMPKLRVLGFAP